MWRHGVDIRHHWRLVWHRGQVASDRGHKMLQCPAPPRPAYLVGSDLQLGRQHGLGGVVQPRPSRPTSAVRSVPTGQPRTQQPAQHKVPTHIIYLGKHSTKQKILQFWVSTPSPTTTRLIGIHAMRKTLFFSDPPSLQFKIFKKGSWSM